MNVVVFISKDLARSLACQNLKRTNTHGHRTHAPRWSSTSNLTLIIDPLVEYKQIKRNSCTHFQYILKMAREILAETTSSFSDKISLSIRTYLFGLKCLVLSCREVVSFKFSPKIVKINGPGKLSPREGSCFLRAWNFKQSFLETLLLNFKSPLRRHFSSERLKNCWTTSWVVKLKTDPGNSGLPSFLLYFLPRKSTWTPKYGFFHHYNIVSSLLWISENFICPNV